MRASSKESSPDRQTATVSRITVRDEEGCACCDLHRLSRMKMMAIEGEGEGEGEMKRKEEEGIRARQTRQ